LALGTKIESDKETDENQVCVYIEETPVEIPEYNAIELFKKAT
jgi:hypothetical protein